MRRTLRRQQRGGATRVLPADTADVQAFVTKKFTDAGFSVVDTPFAFLSTADWLSDPANYATLVAQQDDLFQLAFNHVQTRLELTTDSTDSQIMEAITEKEDAVITECLATLRNVADIVCLGKFPGGAELCSGIAQSKINYNLTNAKRTIAVLNSAKGVTATPAEVSRFLLGNLLIRPLFMKNLVILSIAKIIQTLQSDEATRSIILDPKQIFPRAFLIDKYASYIQTVAYQSISDEPRDFFSLWGCAKTGFTEWYSFFKSFLDTISADTVTLPDKTHVENFVKAAGVLENPGAVTPESMERYGLLTGLFFKHQALSREEILTKFIGEPLTVASGVEGGAAAGGRKPVVPATEFLGMLPITEWEKPIIAGTEITFGKLLRKLSVEEVHYILHLTHVYKTLTAEEVPVTSTAGGGVASGGSGAP